MLDNKLLNIRLLINQYSYSYEMLNELFVDNVGYILDTIIVKPDYSDPYLQ